jgi:hypothetical protein
LYGCDLLYSPEIALQVRTEVASHLGGACPCMLNQRCPLLPDDLTPLLQVRRRPPEEAAS